MTIAHAAFAYLDPEGSAPKCTTRRLSADVAGYLEEHVAALAGKAGSGTAAPAAFLTTDAGALFDALATAGTGGFAEAAQHAADAVHRVMDRRTAPGLYIAVQRGGGAGPRAATLKLEVVSEHAGILRRAGGETVLEVVEDLVDSPGKLQKGAAIPDPRADSDVIVGDRLGPTSEYFLTALGIQQMQHPRTATTLLFQRLAPLVSDPQAIAERLRESDAHTVEEFVESATADVLDAAARAQLVADLSAAKRPVRAIDPRAAPRSRSITGDGITISGSVSDMQRVRLEPRPGGSWRAQIDFEHEPRESFG